LILQDGTFYLLLLVELPDGTPFEAEGVIGVDLGIANIAVDSTGETFSGAQVNGIRSRHRRLRKKLQAKGTKSAKRLLKKRRRKEQRFARDVNHCISKKIVSKAQDTRYMLALEDLKGIRERTEKTVRKA
jgi:transposase